MSFIPPLMATYEDGVVYPRSFEVSDIPIGFNFTVRAWIDLPTDQQSNGTIWINTTVRSQFEPSTIFSHTSKADYQGITWQENVVSDSFDLSAAFTTGLEIFKAWFLMICAVGLSGVIIFKSIIARNQRTLEQQQHGASNQEKSTEAVADWMDKFSETKQDVTEELALEVRSEDFQEAFQSRAGAYKSTSEPVNPALTKAANTVLEFHSSNELRTSADSLLQSIQEGKVSTPHTDNTILISGKRVSIESKSGIIQPLPNDTNDDFDL